MRDISVKLPSERDEYAPYLARFEQWFTQVQRAHGMEGGPLVSVEHSVLRAYITWLRDHEREHHDADQADREV